MSRVSVLFLLALVGCAAAACPKGMKAVTNKQRRQAQPVGYEVRKGEEKRTHTLSKLGRWACKFLFTPLTHEIGLENRLEQGR
jgi:hypothetical protein